MLTKKEATAIINAWKKSGLPYGTKARGFGRKEAAFVVETWLKARGFKPDKNHVRWSPDWYGPFQVTAEEAGWTGRDGAPAADGTSLFGFPLPDGQGTHDPFGYRVEITATQLLNTWCVPPDGWLTTTYSEPLLEVGAGLLAHASLVVKASPRVREDLGRYEERQDEMRQRRQAKRQMPLTLGAYRQRQTFCMNEAALRVLAGVLPEERAGEAAGWLWRMGWSEKTRELFGDAYLAATSQPYTPWPPKRSGYLWYENRHGPVHYRPDAVWRVEVYAPFEGSAQSKALWRIYRQTDLGKSAVLEGELLRIQDRITGAITARNPGNERFCDDAKQLWLGMLARYRDRH